MKKKISMSSIFLLIFSVFFRWIPYEDSEPKESGDSHGAQNVIYDRGVKIVKSNIQKSNLPLEDDRQPLVLFIAYIAKLEEESKIHDGGRNRFELGNLFRKLAGTLLYSQNWTEEQQNEGSNK